jgi:sepiapterin reductase
MPVTNLLLVITGASRGLGRAIANEFCGPSLSGYWPSLRYIRAVLIARSTSGLEETRTAIEANTRKSDLNIRVDLHSIDLSDLNALDHKLDAVFQQIQNDQIKYDRVVLVNNAGSLGALGPCLESPSLSDMRQTVDFNVTSALWTTVRFGRFIRDDERTNDATTTIVNISSLVAVQPFPTMAIYSAVKAARDSYQEAFAQELNGDTNVKFLNYAPGPLETDMANELRKDARLDDNLKPHFQKTLIDPNASAKTLARLVAENSFESGKHIDYFDLQSES